jgi:hypothetical protein
MTADRLAAAARDYVAALERRDRSDRPNDSELVCDVDRCLHDLRVAVIRDTLQTSRDIEDTLPL